MRRTAASLFLIAGIVPSHIAGVVAAQESSGVTSDNGAALIDQNSLPTAIEQKGARPQADPSVLPPAATTLPETLDSLYSPPTLALPDQPGQVRIRELRPLTLAEVEQLAEVNSPSLKAAALEVQQAKSTLRAAISSWYPTLNLTANGLPQYLSGQERFTDNNEADTESVTTGLRQRSGVLTYTEQTSASFRASLNWNLIDPARVPQISAARDSFERARDAYLIALRDLRLTAATAYYNLQRYDSQVDVGKQAVAASLLSLRYARSRFQAGVATKLEVLEAETQLARDRDGLIQSLNSQVRARRDLARIIDLPQDITATAASPAKVVGAWEPSLQESIIAAYAFREELDQFILDISIKNSNANASLAAVQPILTIFNDFSTQRSEIQQTQQSFSTELEGWEMDNAVGLQATWNIFDGGKARADYRRQKQAAEASAYEFANQRGLIRLQVEQSFYDLRANQQTIQTTAREVLSQREALRLARLRFAAGVTTQREVVDNQRDLTRAQTRHVDALSNYNITIAELRRYTGLDQVVACPPLDLPADKAEIPEAEQIQIKPTPEIPACQASLLGS
ncbi:outer membrane channel protein [Synechococcus sp. MIT S9509]|nr:TolC family protein [Synechococcus sp. MIT S9509]KZR88670.1 outer membrane channel protein [Synechococcus sp. MIT S9509]